MHNVTSMTWQLEVTTSCWLVATGEKVTGAGWVGGLWCGLRYPILIFLLLLGLLQRATLAGGEERGERVEDRGRVAVDSGRCKKHDGMIGSCWPNPKLYAWPHASLALTRTGSLIIIHSSALVALCSLLLSTLNLDVDVDLDPCSSHLSSRRCFVVLQQQTTSGEQRTALSPRHGAPQRCRCVAPLVDTI